MKKLFIILMSLPVILMAQDDYNIRSCKATVLETTYKADPAVLKRFSMLEQQIFVCEATGVKVLVDIKKASKAKLDFSFLNKEDGREMKIKDIKHEACLSLIPIMNDWNNSIKNLLESESKHPIEIVLTIQAIKETVMKNEPVVREEGTANVRTWQFYRYRYAEDLMNNLDYPYMLIEKERGNALVEYKKVSDEKLSDAEAMSKLIDQIKPEKTLDNILLTKDCEEVLEGFSLDFQKLDEFQKKEEETIKYNSKEQQEFREHLGKAREHMIKEEYAKAKVEVQEALIIDPTNQEATDLLNTINGKIGEQEKAKKDEQIKVYIKDAKDFIAEAKYEKAKKEIEAALALDENNQEAKQLLEQVNDEIQKQDTQEKISTYLENAKDYMEEEKYAEAKQEANKVLELDANNEEAKKIIQEAEKKLQEQADAEALQNLNGTYKGIIIGIDGEISIAVAQGTASSLTITKTEEITPLPGQAPVVQNTTVTATKTGKNTFTYEDKTIKINFSLVAGNPTLESITVNGASANIEELSFTGL